jgi:hypothetical protein
MAVLKARGHRQRRTTSHFGAIGTRRRRARGRQHHPSSFSIFGDVRGEEGWRGGMTTSEVRGEESPDAGGEVLEV